MPQQDRWSQYEVGSPTADTPSVQTDVPSVVPPSDRWNKYEVGNVSTPEAQPTSLPFEPKNAGTDRWSQYELNQEKPLNKQPSASPESNANDPWYKKAWDWVNEPLIDEQEIEKLLGREGHAGGFEKGVYDLTAGLSSPLSLALTLGTLPFGGEGGLLESGGAAALRVAKIAEKELPEIIRGSKMLADAIRVGKTADEAYALMPAAGIDATKVANGLQKLTEAGLKPDSLYATGVIRNVGSSMLRSAGVSPASADKVSHWVQFMVDSGFTVQNAYGAVAASPKILDAIKEGDYETAKRLAVDAAGSGLFATLGAMHSFKQSGDLMPDAAAKAGLQVKPSEATLQLIKAFEPYAGDIVASGQKFKDFIETTRKNFKDLNLDDMFRARFFQELGDSTKEGLQRAYDLIAKAAGRQEGEVSPTIPNIRDSALDSLMKDHDFIKDHAYRRATAPSDFDRLSRFQDKNLRGLLTNVENYVKDLGEVPKEFEVYLKNAKDALVRADQMPNSKLVTKEQDTALTNLHNLLNEAKRQIIGNEPQARGDIRKPGSKYGLDVYSSYTPPGEGYGPTVYMSPHTIRRFTASETTPWDGVNYSVNNALSGIINLKQGLPYFEEVNPELSDSIKEVIENVNRAIEDARKSPGSGINFVMAYSPESPIFNKENGLAPRHREFFEKRTNDTFREEEFHNRQRIAGRGYFEQHIVDPVRLNSTNMAQRFKQQLLKMGYKEETFKNYPINQVLETAVKIYKGDPDFYSNFTHEEMAEWMESYYMQVIVKMGPEAIKGLIDPRLTSDLSESLMENVYGRIKQRLTKEDERLNPIDRGRFPKIPERQSRSGEGYGGGAKTSAPTESVGTAAGATSDTAFYQQAKQELGENASISQVLQRAQQLKEQHSGPKEPTSIRREPLDLPMLEKHIADLAEEGLLKNKPKAYIDTLLHRLDPSKLNDRQIEFAKLIRDQFDENLALAQKHGVIGEGVDNYFTDIWKKKDNDSINKFRAISDNSSFTTTTPMARHRVFQATIEGLLKGHELEEHNPIELAANNGNSFARVVAARKVLDELQSRGLQTSDGRPMVAGTGRGEVVTDSEGKNPAVLVNPNVIRSIRISDKIIQGLQQKGQLEGLTRRGQIIKIGTDKSGNTMYAWATHDYKTVPHPAFDKWSWASQDTAGHPVQVKGELRVHPEAEEYLKRRLGLEKSTISQKLRPLLAAGAEAKGLLLFFSPFHAMQEGLRALMTGVNPWGIEKYNNADPIHRLAAEKGVLENWGNQKAMFQEGLAGHSKLLSKIPGLAQIQDWYQTWLFDKYLPGLKMRAFRSLYERYRNDNKGWTTEKAAAEAAADTNSRFGGLSYQRMGRSLATQDIARIVALAPDWLESELRFMARAFHPGGEGAIARKDLTRAALALWGAARVLNLLSTGNAHNEAPFGLAMKDKDGKEKVYSIRTLPTDMLHAMSDPEGFLKGRVAPLMRAAAQTYTGRDEFGRKIPEHGMLVNLLRQVSPIPIQTAVKAATGETPDITSGDAALKAAGFTVYPYRTEGQKKAAQLASDHSESGPVDEDKLKRHQAILEVENRIRSGQAPLSDVYHMVEQGAIHIDEAKQIVKNYKETQGMDVDTSRFYAHVARLPMKEVIDVWNASSPQEHAAISKLLIKKKNAYMKNALKNMSPAERDSDSTYQWIKRSFPGDPLGLGVVQPTGMENSPSQGMQKYQSKSTNSADTLPKEAPVVKGVKVDSLAAAYKVFEGRPLNPEELKAVSPVFQNLIDLGQIRVHDVPESVLNYLSGDKGTLGVEERSNPGNIGIAKPGAFGKDDERAVIGHEITHEYQTLGGKYLQDPTKRVFGNNTNPHNLDLYDYGTPKQLDKLRSEGKTFSDMTDEQQAKLVQDYIYYSQHLGTPDSKGLLKSIQPYVNDLIASQSFKKAADKVPPDKPNMLDQLEDTALRISRWLNRYL